MLIERISFVNVNVVLNVASTYVGQFILTLYMNANGDNKCA
jgi:hypothetical protein